MRFGVCATLLSSLLLASSPIQAAAGAKKLSLPYGDGTFTVPLPHGFCAPVREDANFRLSAFFSRQREGQIHLLGWSIPCKDLYRHREGSLEESNTFLLVTLIAPSGEVKRLRKLTPQKYARIYASVYADFPRSRIAGLLRSPDPFGSRTVGYLTHDETSAYTATFRPIHHFPDGRSKFAISTSVNALVGNYQLQVSIFTHDRDIGQIDSSVTLLRSVRHLFAYEEIPSVASPSEESVN